MVKTSHATVPLKTTIKNCLFFLKYPSIACSDAVMSSIRTLLDVWLIYFNLRYCCLMPPWCYSKGTEMNRNCSLITSLEKSPNCHSLSAASFPITICSWHSVHSFPSSLRKLGTRGERCRPSESRHATGWGVAGTTQRRQGGDWKGCASVRARG